MVVLVSAFGTDKSRRVLLSQGINYSCQDEMIYMWHGDSNEPCFLSLHAPYQQSELKDSS